LSYHARRKASPANPVKFIVEIDGGIRLAEREARHKPTPQAIVVPPNARELFANKTEAAYADHLERRRLAEEIYAWRYESVTFKLGHDCRYTPDFWVVMANGRVEIHEVKGHMEDDALVKLKVFAAQHPYLSVIVVHDKGKHGSGGWGLREIKPR
jgi:hypothetical protein